MKQRVGHVPFLIADATTKWRTGERANGRTGEMKRGFGLSPDAPRALLSWRACRCRDVNEKKTTGN
jgi:hypothetical protein